MTRHVEDRDIREYLLGNLAEEDEAAVEAAYFADTALLERIETAASDLADDYAAGRLSPGDRIRFERRQLASAAGREDVALARALQAVAKVDQRPGGAVTALLPWLGWATAALLIVGAALQVWPFGSKPDPAATAPPSVVAAPSRTTSPAPAPAPPSPADPAVPDARPAHIAVLLLTADLARSEGRPPILIPEQGVTYVDLVLPSTDVPPDSARGQVQSVEGEPVWTGPVEPATAPDTGARARVPVANLPPGDYLFSVTDGAAYYFRVRSRP